MVKDNRVRAMEGKARRLERRLIGLQRVTDRFSLVRLLVFLSGAAVSGIGLLLSGFPLFVLLFVLTAIGFVVAVVFHRRVENSLARHRAWLAWTRTQVARMRLDWDQLPPARTPGNRHRQPLELDFDLIGERSLHRLLDTAVSAEGSERLRHWLHTHPSETADIENRQAIVRELHPLALFRGRLAVDGRLAAGEQPWTARRLTEWLAQHPMNPSWRKWLLPLVVLAALNMVLFTLNRLAGVPPWWQATLTIYILLSLWATRGLGDTFREAAALQAALEQLQIVFGHLERWNYHRVPHLAQLCRPFLDPERRPSHDLKRIRRVVSATGVRGNPVLWLLLNLLLPWDLYFANHLQQQKQLLARHLPDWLETWFELESLSALANLAYLNPHYTFPRFLASDAAVCFQANHLSHPLLPDADKVGNDLTIQEAGQVFIFTGSNMAGKSTFLRTSGCNLCLAYAGGPVSATHLATSHFRLYSCVRITDSVTDGISYFYAEVKCLKGLLAELEREHGRPLLYFIDEIFRGTNNRERLIGSRAYIRAVAGKNGVGLIATHDLELAKLADEIPAVRNYHFREEVANGRMVFDYTLRPGPSPTTNALKIMELEGLPVQIR
jgi:hypothetical protein